jgi:phosphatidylserine/phosphatidylglycerophosphate/cardiolipin synthase-like enzyme
LCPKFVDTQLPSQYTPNTQKRVSRKERPARNFARLALSHYAKEDVKQVVDLVQDGIAVKSFTNSPSSAGVVPGVAMDRKIRKDLLKAGAQLYEMRPKPELTKTLHEDIEEDLLAIVIS